MKSRSRTMWSVHNRSSRPELLVPVVMETLCCRPTPRRSRRTSGSLWTTRGTRETPTPATPRDERNRKRRCGLWADPGDGLTVPPHIHTLLFSSLLFCPNCSRNDVDFEPGGFFFSFTDPFLPRQSKCCRQECDWLQLTVLIIR